jgi:hypothetical protein
MPKEDIINETCNFQTNGNLNWRIVETKGGRDVFIEGDITTDDPDLENDVVTQKGLDHVANQLQDRNLTLDLEHETFRDENDQLRIEPSNRIAVGKVVEVKRMPHSVRVRAKLNTHIAKFPTIFKSIKDGFLRAFSITFGSPVKSSTKVIKGERFRFLDSLNILNVALTATPVNPRATFAPVMKSLVKTIEDEEKSQSDKTNKEKNMTEEKTEATAPVEGAEAPAPATETAEPTVEAPVPAEPTPDAPVDAGAAETESTTQMKALIEAQGVTIKALTAEMKSLKNAMNAPQMKAKIHDTPAEPAQAAEPTLKGTLGLIR